MAFNGCPALKQLRRQRASAVLLLTAVFAHQHLVEYRALKEATVDVQLMHNKLGATIQERALFGGGSLADNYLYISTGPSIVVAFKEATVVVQQVRRNQRTVKREVSATRIKSQWRSNWHIFGSSHNGGVFGTMKPMRIGEQQLCSFNLGRVPYISEKFAFVRPKSCYHDNPVILDAT